MSGTHAIAALRSVLPADAVIVAEAPAVAGPLRELLRLSAPGSYFFTSGGGLGFGLAGAIGVQLAWPQRPVVAVVGDGSAQYTIQALWSAAAYRIPLTVLVVRNDEYAILKWFAAMESVQGAPGLDLPGLDVAALAAGYGVRARRAEDPEELAGLLAEAIASGAPEVVEARVAPGMAPL
jgi:benzoylformate decarboxylase